MTKHPDPNPITERPENPTITERPQSQTITERTDDLTITERLDITVQVLENAIKKLQALLKKDLTTIEDYANIDTSTNEGEDNDAEDDITAPGQ